MGSSQKQVPFGVLAHMGAVPYWGPKKDPNLENCPCEVLEIMF